jgi:ribosomal protein L3 glutamine methyltransferase
MNLPSLRERLQAATTHEAWVDALAALFRSHDLFFGHGTDNAEDEAYWLIRHLQGYRDELWERAPDTALIPKLAELAARRVEERKPLAYLLGEAWFAGLRFTVDERVLIPRSPLAEIIERRFRPWCEPEPGERVLDIGTGSGCLAVATAYHCPGVGVDATDVSEAALAVAAENVGRHGFGSRIRLCRSDLFPAGERRYRVIISNPPYVAGEHWRDLPAEYAHEPARALVAGATGLEVAERILRGAGERLAPRGVLIMEVGEGGAALMRAHPRLPAVWSEFERGGDGVLVLTAEQLREYFRRRG